MAITPHQRILAYELLGNLLVEDHRLFMILYQSVKLSVTPPFVARLPVENCDRQIYIFRRTAELLPYFESDVHEVLRDYINERQKVIEVLSGETDTLETDDRRLNEAYQEVLSQISQAIARNQEP